LGVISFLIYQIQVFFKEMRGVGVGGGIVNYGYNLEPNPRTNLIFQTREVETALKNKTRHSIQTTSRGMSKYLLF